MSLLIKALDKAQAEKAQAKDGVGKKSADKAVKNNKPKVKKASEAESQKPADEALSLSPPEDTLTTNTVEKKPNDDMPAALKDSAADKAQKEGQQPIKHQLEPALTLENSPNDNSQAQAANVFAVKQIEPSHQSVKIAVIVGILALALLAAFAYWYQFVLNAPDIVIPPRPPIAQTIPEELPEPAMVEEKVSTADSDVSMMSAEGANENAQPAVVMETEVQQAKAEPAQKPASINAFNDGDTGIEETLAPNEIVIAKPNEDVVTLNASSIDLGIASESASIQITQDKTESGVNPILMRAYEAYNAGNDQQAQADYKQVLQRFGSNVDAMLGLGAIATRQGRMADAYDWYQKVLELEPRNDVAKTGLLSVQQESQPQNSESRIKSMLASTPEDANLHAALGDVYASQNNWTSAQQAYFDAYRFNSSAENAFNLGVSLDQLGKSNLALPYYQEALQKADQSSVIDTAALEARISSIQ
jgi:tetratricopeptide (TPR) repeat protein